MTSKASACEPPWVRTALQNPPSDTVVLGYSEVHGYSLYEVHDCDGYGMTWGYQYGDVCDEPDFWMSLPKPPEGAEEPDDEIGVVLP